MLHRLLESRGARARAGVGAPGLGARVRAAVRSRGSALSSARAPRRRGISCPDASLAGGGAAEARRFHQMSRPGSRRPPRIGVRNSTILSLARQVKRRLSVKRILTLLAFLRLNNIPLMTTPSSLEHDLKTMSLIMGKVAIMTIRQ